MPEILYTIYHDASAKQANNSALRGISLKPVEFEF